MTDPELSALVRYLTYAVRRAHMAGCDLATAYAANGSPMTLDDRVLESARYVAQDFDPETIRRHFDFYLAHPER